jgi:branched-chain amino acid aminotransferase/4-amino-4-deoxychorismate lyase
LLWKGGALVLAAAHWARMAAGAAALGLPAPPEAAFLDAAAGAVREAGLAQARAAVRVTLTAGSGGRGLDRPPELQPRLFATAAPSPKPSEPASLIVASVRRNEASPASRLKTLAYLDNVLARREARAAGADEAVMLNTQGELACAAAANLFWIEDGVVCTPAPATGCLPGVMAAQVCAAARGLVVELREAFEGPAALEQAEAIFLTNSLIGVRPANLLGRPREAHPLIAALAKAISAWA